MLTESERQQYYSGSKLYGDDFGPAELASWYEDEREGYADMLSASGAEYRYRFHALNQALFRRLPPGKRFRHALGLGSAHAHEFEPLADRIEQITVVEPSDAFDTKSIGGAPVTRVKPEQSGDLPFEDKRFDLVMCFGVLHHIANVSHVVHELGRCTASGGFAFIREPATTMGEWDGPRPGLTKRERGIPKGLLERFVADAGFQILEHKLCIFPPLEHALRRLGVTTYNSQLATRLDSAVSKVFEWNYRYHRPRLRHKFAPSALNLALVKR